MAYKKILTIQDISCVGQCSLTVALPVISACGVETCVLPSAVLSTHTGGFQGFTFRDLAEDMPTIRDHWVKENIQFDAIYTGYLGSCQQIDYVLSIFDANSKEHCVKIVDPAMADNGVLYTGFDMDYVQVMKRLSAKAEYLLPNMTEAALLTDTEYRTEYDRAYIDTLLQGLTDLGCKNIVLTGVSYAPDKTGVVVMENGSYAYYEHDKEPNSSHGTGDVYASSFVGALMRGKTAAEAARIAADFVVRCLRFTAKIENHHYGVAFEPLLGELIEMLK